MQIELKFKLMIPRGLPRRCPHLEDSPRCIFHNLSLCSILRDPIYGVDLVKEYVWIRNAVSDRKDSLKKKKIFFFYSSKKEKENTLWKILCRSGRKFERCTWGKIKICKKGRNDIFVQSETYILTSRVAITLSQFMKTKTRRNFRRALCSPNYGKRTHRAHFA